MRLGVTSLIAMMALLVHLPARAADYGSLSGPQLYQRFCASCHGEAAHGDGPVAAWLKVEVPDLTLIEQRAGGKFPRERVEQIIDGRFVIGSHGSRTMPIWGEDFAHTQTGNPDGERVTRAMLAKLVDYLWQIQAPRVDHVDHGVQR
jgi:mono/diheme cytochrome c family protein